MEFQHPGPVARQMPLKAADVLEALFPDPAVGDVWRQLLPRQHLGMHAHHQHFLIVRAIEDADMPALWQRSDGSPQKIVRQFLGARSFEGVALRSLAD